MFNSLLKNRQILLGVTGGIAAYKTPELVRLLKKSGADVRVILSKGALDFVTPLTLETVSGNAVHVEPFEPGNPMLHIELARWADDFLISPLTANRLASLAHGFGDDLMSTTYLATRAKIWVAPAMNKQMWEHPAVMANMSLLKERGVEVIGPEAGEQACLDVGLGRMSEPTDIVRSLVKPTSQGLLKGKRVMITAGPTREAIDPVRFISNRSSGKMGYCLAQAAISMGASVELVSGPVHLEPPSGVQFKDVMSAKEMYSEVLEHIAGVDVFIATAAVADYRPKEVSLTKIKKQDKKPFAIEYVENPDILSVVAAQPNRPFCVGFAAETHNGENNALAKLEAKGIDMIALNSVDKPNVGFEHDTNALTVYSKGESMILPLTSKKQIAEQLLKLIVEKCNEKNNRT